MKKRFIVEVIVVLYSILFIYTAISKIIDYDIFKEQLSASPILGPVSNLVAITLPWLELFITALLIIPRWRIKGLYFALFLMTAFTLYIGTTLIISDKLPCSCGGIISAMSWSQHLIFNTIFIILGATGVILERKQLNEQKQYWISIPKTT